MAIIIDCVLVALFIFSVIRHYKLGLACSVLSAGKLLFSFLAAGAFARPIASLLMLAFDESELTAQGAKVLSGVLAFILVFLAVFILSGFIIRMLSKIKVPIITKLDKLLGLVLGAVIGILSVSAIATVIYSAIEMITFINNDSAALAIYYDSYVFRSVYELHIFEFIRNLI